ncbi:MAG: hypothetical protein L0241_21230 [Planctomycetia bacterium]|nr:hypothetical protein [Planctomycetia bacterium]
MRDIVVFFVTLGASFVLAAPVPQPNVREAAQLVEKLGSSDFAEREAATKRLDELGVLALEELRAACKSENPEIAERAKDLVRKIERRVSSQRALAPTMVEIEAQGIPLDAVLAALSKQAGCEVVLGGLKPDELAGKKITVNTGKVPFWTAVLNICDAADLQVANVSGFMAPGSMPYLAKPGKPKEGVTARVAAIPSLAVVLEARDGAQKRPASVHSAVLIEAFELPKAAALADVAAAVLQVWPEPKLGWHSSANVKITKSIGANSAKLVPDYTPNRAMPQVKKLGGGAIGVVNPDGTVTLVNPGAANPLVVGPNFTPNVRQTLVKFKSSEKVASELTGSVYGLVRSAPEPLATVTLDPDKPVAVTGRAGVEMTASVRADGKGKKFVVVKLVYHPITVEPVRRSDELPEVKPDSTGSNQTTLGVRVTDAKNTALDVSVRGHVSNFAQGGRSIVIELTLGLPDAKDAPIPAKVVFWGNYLKPVEVPFALKDVPLVSRAK